MRSGGTQLESFAKPVSLASTSSSFSATARTPPAVRCLSQLPSQRRRHMQSELSLNGSSKMAVIPTATFLSDVVQLRSRIWMGSVRNPCYLQGEPCLVAVEGLK